MPLFAIGASTMSTHTDAIDAPLRSAMADDPYFADLLRQFVAQLPQRVAEMESALQNQRWDDLQRFTHQMKGAGGGYGFIPLSAAAALAEQLLIQKASPEDIRLATQSLTNLCRRAQAD